MSQELVAATRQAVLQQARARPANISYYSDPRVQEIVRSGLSLWVITAALVEAWDQHDGVAPYTGAR